MPDHLEVQVFAREGIVIIAAAKKDCLAMPIAYLSPNEADAFATTVKEMAATARRSGEIVHQLKTGA